MSRPPLPPFALDDSEGLMHTRIASINDIAIAETERLYHWPAGRRPDTKTYASDVAFTDTVKAIQARKGSRTAYARMEAGGSWEQSITADLKIEIESQVSVFLATANADGQPYIQHRGGPAGFLQVLDDHTIGFADFVGNRQYITQGNLAENPKSQLFLIDYANQRRIKVWGTARVVEGDVALPMCARPSNRVTSALPRWRLRSRVCAADHPACVNDRVPEL